MKLTIVGGGTSGLITGLMLKKRFTDTIDIQVIKSDKIGVIGVGEGSTEHWNMFANYMGIDRFEVIKETGAVFKVGVKYEGWMKNDFMHNVDGQIMDMVHGQYRLGYGTLINDNRTNKDYIHKNFWSDNLNHSFVPYQMNFNAAELNKYLLKLCDRFNIKLITDEIKDVNMNEDGSIKSLTGKIEYESDFFIDSTGFKKLLISKLGAKWQSYSDYILMNEAIAFPTEDTEKYPLYTHIRAMDAGWTWSIPVWGRWGNGYTFNNNFINADKAQEEVEKKFGKKINIFKNIKFESGRLDKVWIKNCVAVGLSASFIEPLEASAIATSIQQGFLLNHHLTNYNENTIKVYNDKVNTINQNILEFICLCYLVDKNDTDFWKQEFKMPDTLQFKLDIWKNKLPIFEHFDSKYLLFNESNFIVALHGRNLLNVENIKKEYMTLPESLRKNAYNNIVDIMVERQEAEDFDHKELISKIRQGDDGVEWLKYNQIDT